MNVNEMLGTKEEMYRDMGHAWKNTLRVACPGIIESFNPKEQTVTVQPTIREHLRKEDGTREWVQLPLLLDVPIQIPRAGGYSLTLPIKKGDECLVVFLDSCIDGWWSYGNIQNQIEKRRHDLSDAVAILSIWSQPNVLPNYSTDSCQLRNDKGTSYIDLKDDEINLKSGRLVFNGVVWDTHTHQCPHGGSTSGPE